MDPTITVALIVFGGTLYTGLVSWITAKVNTRSGEKTKKLEVEAAAYNRAKEIWDSVIDDLRTQVTDNRSEMRTLRERVDSLEKGRAEDQARLRRAAAYVNQLTKLLLAAHVVPPPLPTGIFDDNLIEDTD